MPFLEESVYYEAGPCKHFFFRPAPKLDITEQVACTNRRNHGIGKAGTNTRNAIFQTTTVVDFQCHLRARVCLSMSGWNPVNALFVITFQPILQTQVIRKPRFGEKQRFTVLTSCCIRALVTPYRRTTLPICREREKSVVQRIIDVVRDLRRVVIHRRCHMTTSRILIRVRRSSNVSIRHNKRACASQMIWEPTLRHACLPFLHRFQGVG